MGLAWWVAYPSVPMHRLWLDLAALLAFAWWSALASWGLMGPRVRRVHGSDKEAWLSAVAVIWSLLAMVLGMGASWRGFAAVLVAIAVGMLASRRNSSSVLDVLAIAMLVGAIGNSLAGAVQYWMPFQADDRWVAYVESYGRAGGNLRQPNHLGTLAVWGLLALAWMRYRLRISFTMATLLGVTLLATIAMTQSRTALLSLSVCAVWALAFGSRWPSWMRSSMVASPILAWLMWSGLQWLVRLLGIGFLSMPIAGRDGPDLSAGRIQLWRNAFELIAARPWAGFGPGEFGSAWHLMPLRERPLEYYDHGHNLLVHVAVELGIPIALMLGASLVVWFGAALRRSGSAREDSVVSKDIGQVMLAVMCVHSMLEYPLWSAYFLLPTAMLIGLQLSPGTQGSGEATGTTRFAWEGFMFAFIVAAGCSAVAYDFIRQVAPGFTSRHMSIQKQSLLLRSSWAFSDLFRYHQASRAKGPGSTHQIEEAMQDGNDVRLMIAYADALEADGHRAQAIYVAQRLREFHREPALGYLGACGPVLIGLQPDFRCDTDPSHALPPTHLWAW